MPEFCDDCFKAVRHEGEPEGKIVEIGGIKSYVATPTSEYAKDKVVLFLSDVFGLELVSNKLLVDDFARNGLRTVFPDYLNDDPMPVNAAGQSGFDKMGWRARHTAAQTRPPVDAVISALKAEGVTKFGVTGFCFGARFCVDLALDGAADVVVLSHPSMLKVPGNFEDLLAKGTAPLLINSCEDDAAFPLESQAAVDGLLGKGEYKTGYVRTYWPGCTHGFAVRGDMTNPQVKAGKEGAFKASVDFFHAYL